MMFQSNESVTAFDGLEPENTSLIVEAILKEMSLSKRWATVDIAWSALLRVRLMAKQYSEEMQRINPGPAKACSGSLGKDSF